MIMLWLVHKVDYTQVENNCQSYNGNFLTEKW